MQENKRLVKFLFHKGEILVEMDRENQPVSRFMRGHGVEACEQGEGTYFYYKDEQSSTSMITGKDRGIENLYCFDAFGAQKKSKESIPNRIGYTGQQLDGIIGQYYLRARFYNPVLGRFLQEDAYHGDGLNLYSYCENNPVVYYDPSGYAKANCPDPSKINGDGSQGDQSPEGKKYYTVQGEEVINRYLNGGDPWPKDGYRANLGDGVYAWDNIQDAENYLTRRQVKIAEPLYILEFTVSKDNMGTMNIFDTRGLSDDLLNEFFDRYGRLYGGTPDHGYDYIINDTNSGLEHYFSKTIFEKLTFNRGEK